MPRFIVDVMRLATLHAEVDVEAATETEAKYKARLAAVDLPPEAWEVREVLHMHTPKVRETDV